MSVGLVIILLLALCIMALGGYYFIVFLVDRNFSFSTKKPRFGLFRISDNKLGFWVYWDNRKNKFEFYRLKILRISPQLDIKQETFSFTFNVVQKEPFIGEFELPVSLFNLISKSGVLKKRSVLLSFQFKTTNENQIFRDFYIEQIVKIYLGKTMFGSKRFKRKCTNETGSLKDDDFLTSLLSYEELSSRKNKIVSASEKLG